MKASARGFTLIEVLVAMSIFALVALIAGAITSAALDLRADLDEQQARLGRLQTAHALVKADLAQMVARPTRDAFGSEDVFGLDGDSLRGDGVLLRFVRGGWGNPGGAEARSSLQYVEYVVQDQKFIRRSRGYLDPTPSTPATDVVLLEHVEDADLKFMAGGAWVSEWKPNIQTGAVLPNVIALEISLKPFGVIRQLYAVPTS